MTIVKISATAFTAAMMAAMFVPAANAAMDETVVDAPVNYPTARVSYHDLNLTRAADVDQLQARVNRAARNVCSVEGLTDTKRMSIGAACFDKALENAAPQIATAINNAETQVASNGAIVVAMQ